MGIVSTPINIMVSEREVSYTSSITIYRSKPLDRFVFRSSLDTEVPVSYIGDRNRTSDTEVFISDGTRFEAGLLLEGGYGWSRQEQRSFYTETLDLLITNRAVVEGGQVVPLWYGMNLPVDTIDASIGSNIPREDIPFIFDKVSKVIYTSGKNYWDPALRDFRGLTIRYQTPAGYFNKVFSGRSVYREVEIPDIDPNTLTVPPGRTVFSVEKMGPRFRVTLSGNGPWFVQKKRRMAFSLEKVKNKSLDKPWNIKVTNAKTSLKHPSLGTLYYRVPEYENTQYFPYYPYVQVNEEALVIDKKTLKVSNENLALSTERGLYLKVIVYDRDKNLKYCYSDSPYLIGKPFDRWSNDFNGKKWVAIDASADESNGIIVVNNMPPFLETDKVDVSYCYKEGYYILRDLNLNPRSNSWASKCFYMVWVVPTRDEENGKSIFWAEIESDSMFGLSNIVRRSNFSQISALKGGGATFVTLANLMDQFTIQGGSWILLGMISVSSELNIEALVKEDVRLKPGVDRKNELKILKKHPWLYWNKLYKDKQIEYPDKRFSFIEIDRESILVKDRKVIEKKIEKFLPLGNAYTWREDGFRMRVKSIHKIAENFFVVEHMTEPRADRYQLHRALDNQTHKIPSDLTVVAEWSEAYQLNTLHSEVLEIEGLTPGIHRFYAVAVDDEDNYSIVSDFFEVRV